jgi:formylglycine-generating enzyme
MRKKQLLNIPALLLVLGSALLLGMYKEVPKVMRPDDMIYVSGGKLPNTTGQPINVNAFFLDKNLVTVAEFDEFVKLTSYVTDAEKYGDAGVFDSGQQIFISVPGANYKFPFGKDKPEAERDHPVTQVSWNDASAYAQWRGKRLPTQHEWELAASQGTDGVQQYAWGSALVVNGTYKANTWQGSFPFYNSAEDGYVFTSPVGAFGANAIGLTDMGGNVWQWCSDIVEASGADKIVDPSQRRVLKGGSYLCDPLVCHGYQIFGLSSSTPESSMAHIGFRCARNIK